MEGDDGRSNGGILKPNLISTGSRTDESFCIMLSAVDPRGPCLGGFQTMGGFQTIGGVATLLANEG